MIIINLHIHLKPLECYPNVIKLYLSPTSKILLLLYDKSVFLQHFTIGWVHDSRREIAR